MRRWFEKRDEPASVSLALAVGELKAELAQVRREIDRLKPPPPAPPDPAHRDLSPYVRTFIQSISQGYGELNRHLEQEARAMLADHKSDQEIIAAIRRGS